MKARYQYRIYPTIGQSSNLARLFGCCRVVWNDALALCRQLEKLPNNGDLQQWCITQVKQTTEREWLKEVSNIPLQQSMADLGVAFKNFFQSFKGKRPGPRVRLPRFKNLNIHEHVVSTGERCPLPTFQPLDRRIRRLQRRWARQSKGSNRREVTRFAITKLTVRKETILKDALHQFSTRLIRENQTVYLEDLNVSGMVKNRRLARAISECGFGMLHTLVELKGAQYEGREVQVISRWQPTSQVCSQCGDRWGKLDLSVRSIQCLNCEGTHDRDANAARNIEQSEVKQPQDYNWAVNGHKTRVSGHLIALPSHEGRACPV